MGLFSLKKTSSPAGKKSAQMKPVDAGTMAQLALRAIRDGVIIVDKSANVKFINPAGVEMTGIGSPENAFGLNVPLVMKLETQDGNRVAAENDKVLKAISDNIQFETKEYVLLGQGDKTTPVAICVIPSGDPRADRLITFRNIAKELEEEGAQAEFISTASHEMRTPVASIEGYLGLALNPQTASIDARARQYLESAHTASQRLGNLFKDLLDVTRLEDKRVHARPVPVELTGFVKKFADEYIPKFKEKNLSYSFGTDTSKAGRIAGGIKTIEQLVYTFVDVDFLGEILSNLIENAIKYTPNGGAVWVNVQGDGDRALINVTDTGIGIAAEDLQHVFQKFYRADNSQTRTVGGTGLGLYLVKQRAEAMEGRVWAESAFGEGSTFYVSLPRLTAAEFEKRQIAAKNQQAVQMFAEQALNQRAAANAAALKGNLPTLQREFNPNVLQQTMQIPTQQPTETNSIQQQATVMPPQQPIETSQMLAAAPQQQPGVVAQQSEVMSQQSIAATQQPVAVQPQMIPQIQQSEPVPQQIVASQNFTQPIPQTVSQPLSVPQASEQSLVEAPLQPQALVPPQQSAPEQTTQQLIHEQTPQQQIYVQPEIGATDVQPIQSAIH